MREVILAIIGLVIGIGVSFIWIAYEKLFGEEPFNTDSAQWSEEIQAKMKKEGREPHEYNKIKGVGVTPDINPEDGEKIRVIEVWGRDGRIKDIKCEDPEIREYLLKQARDFPGYRRRG